MQNIERPVTPKKRMDALGLEPRTDRLLASAAMMNKMDVFIDDPRKAAVFEARSVHVVRPSELIMAATTTEHE